MYVEERGGEGANVIFGASFDESVQDEVSITVIATGLESVASDSPVATAMSKFKTAPRPQTSMGIDERSMETTLGREVSRTVNAQQAASPRRAADDSLQIPDFLQRNPRR